MVVAVGTCARKSDSFGRQPPVRVQKVQKVHHLFYTPYSIFPAFSFWLSEKVCIFAVELPQTVVNAAVMQRDLFL